MDDKYPFDSDNKDNDIDNNDVDTSKANNDYDTVEFGAVEDTEFKYVSDDECVINDKSDNNDVPVGVVNSNKEQRKKFRLGGVFRSIAFGAFCLVLGMYLTLFALPYTSFFKNTPLYNSLNSGNASEQSIKNIATGTGLASTTEVSSNTKTFSTEYIVKNVQQSVVQVTTESATTGISSLKDSNTVSGLGTGFIINNQGQILTNYHVIAEVVNSGKLNVVLYSGKIVPAKIINFNADYDLALIQITDASVKIPAVATLGNSDRVQIGDDVIAIGNPLSQDLSGTVTKGIISAKGRSINNTGTIGDKVKYLQTDAAINSGNSGGPLFNMSGEVIGINAEKASTDSSSGTSTEGIGFAIPINTAKDLLIQLSKENLLLGIGGTTVTKDVQKQANLAVSEGFVISTVAPGTPAAIAGMKPGDVITKFDGDVVVDINTVNDVKARHKAGDILDVVVNRNGKNVNLKIKLAAK